MPAAPLPVPDLIPILLRLLTQPPPPPVVPPPVIVGGLGEAPIAGMAWQALIVVACQVVKEKFVEYLYPPEQAQKELHDITLGFVQLFTGETQDPMRMPALAPRVRPKRKARQNKRWRFYGYTKAKKRKGATNGKG